MCAVSVGGSSSSSAASNSGPGSCFPGDAMVVTPNGPLSMRHLQLGDKVRSSRCHLHVHVPMVPPLHYNMAMPALHGPGGSIRLTLLSFPIKDCFLIVSTTITKPVCRNHAFTARSVRVLCEHTHLYIYRTILSSKCRPAICTATVRAHAAVLSCTVQLSMTGPLSSQRIFTAIA